MRRLALLAALAATLAFPGAASAGLGWHDAGAGVPASVKLNDVARTGDTVIAVGTDTVTGEPVIYRRAGETWHRDTLAAPAGTLVDVDAGPDGAFAVGYADHALLVHLPGAAMSGAAQTWAPVPGAETIGQLLSVGVSGTGGIAGNDAGGVHPFTAASVGSAATTRAGAPVNGIALTAPDTGYAVTNGTALDNRIFKLKSGPTAESDLALDTAGQHVQSVAVLGSEQLAVDTGGFWRVSNGAWTRTAIANSPTLTDADLGPDVQAIAGAIGGNGHVWRRRHSTDGWSADPVAPGRPINGVAATGAEEIYAVGDGGTVLRYWRAPDPASQPCNCEPAPGPAPGPAPSTGSTGTASTTTTSGNTTTTTTPPQQKGDPTIYVVERNPPKKRGKPRRRHRRLLDRVKVRRLKRRLIVSFRVRARARVAIAAKRGRRVVSRSRSRAMRPGRRRVVLRFKGKPPTALRIVVRPLPAKKARGRTRGGNAGA